MAKFQQDNRDFYRDLVNNRDFLSRLFRILTITWRETIKSAGMLLTAKTKKALRLLTVDGEMPPGVRIG